MPSPVPAGPAPSRRAVLGGMAAAAVALTAPARGAAAHGLYPDADAVEARLRALPGVRLRQVGASRSGRAIPLFSLGEGARDVLVVAGAHANEPVGGLAACLLGERIARGEGPEGLVWHIIGCVDPDGLALNRSWLPGRIAPADYFRGFFRPAFERQPEYAFPIEVDDYRFDAATAENRAWQQALALTRPALQVGLHGADYGGAFYLADRPSPALADALAGQPERFGITLNPFGEPFSDMHRHAPGLFDFIDIAGFVRANRGERSGMWVGGDSSARFAARVHGSANFVCEAPMWEDGRLRDLHPSGRSLADVVRRHRARLERLVRIVLPVYAALPRTGDAQLRAALDEWARMAPLQLGFADRILPTLPADALSVRDFAIHDTALAFIALRPVAMLARLGRRPAIAAELARGIRTLGARLTLVPPARAAALQADATLLAAAALAGSGRLR